MRNGGTVEMKLRVYGVPKPGGSKKGFVNKNTGHVIITEDNKGSKPWRAMCVSAFLDTLGLGVSEPPGPVYPTGPVRLEIIFLMPRPKYHYNSKGFLKESAPFYHIIAPDSSKLTRSTEDAFKGLAWRDDCQVAIQSVSKIYAEVPGAEITITRIDA